MSNTFLPWAAYRDIVVGHIIRLDKFLGIHPVVFGEILQYILSKSILKACIEGLSHMCGMDQLCLGFWGGIEGVINVMNSLWAERRFWVVLWVDSDNFFNKINSTEML